MVYGLTDPLQRRRAGLMFRFECQPHTDNFQRISNENARDARRGPTEQPAQRRFVRGGRNEHRAELLIGEEFDGCVGEDAEEGGGMASEETAEAGLPIYISHGSYHAEPRAGVFGKLGVRGLEEDFDAVEGADDRFCLGNTVSMQGAGGLLNMMLCFEAYRTSGQPASEPCPKDIV